MQVSFSTLHVSNSIFANNNMPSASAVFSNGAGTFINNTVYGNTDQNNSSAAVYFSSSTASWVVANNIIYGNTGGHQLRFETITNKTMAHNLIEGNSIANGPTRIGPLTAPATAAGLFASTTATHASYLRLLPGVAAIGGGNNDYIDGNADAFEVADTIGVADLAGDPRINTTTVDVGAYELRVPPPRPRYVKPTATGTMDGSSWANAMTLQAALDGYMYGDLLYLMSGSYTPTAKDEDGMAVAMGEERDATYILPNGVPLYGGFAGTETSHTARDMDEIHDDNATIIEGDIGTMRTETEANNTDNIKRLFLLASNVTVTLDGLTVARAHLDGGLGGGLLGGTGANITLRQCRFIGNKANSGGAVYVGAEGTLTLTNSTFEGNSSGNDGGAIFVEAGVTFMATGSTFRENAAADGQKGSAINLFSLAANASTGTISSCSFFENSATGNAWGTVYAAAGATLDVSNSVFAGNSMGRGASVYSLAGNGIFINNTVYDNRNGTSGSAAVSLATLASTWVVANNIIYGNTGGSHQLRFAGATNKAMVHNLIEGNSIENGPTRIGALTAPATAAEVFASTTATHASYLRLLPGVPAVNGGNNDYIDGNADAFEVADTMGVADLAGDPRIITTTVDVGAYEFRGSSITLTPVPADLSNLSNEEGTIAVSVVLGGFADDYTVNLDKATFTTSSVVDGVLTLSYSANTTTSVREDTVAFSTTSTMGGEGPARDSLFLRQMASVPQTVGLTPDNLMDVPAVGGTRTVMLTLGGGATSYMTSGAADWVTVPAMGMAGEVSLTLDANTTTSARQSMVTFTPTGGTGEATTATLMISQLGALPAGPSVTLTPPSLDDVPAMGGIHTVMLTLGGDATGYTTSGAADWVTVPATGMAGEVSLTLDANTATSARQSTVIFTPTGGTGEATTATLMISQLGALPAGPSVTLSPDRITGIPALGGMRSVTATFTGGANGYTVPMTGIGAPASWVTVPAMANAAGVLNITLGAENTMTMERKDTVIFMPTGGMGTAIDDSLFITQLGTESPMRHRITLNPDRITGIPASGGMRRVTAIFTGGANGYTVPMTGIGAPASWVTVPAMATSTGVLNITLEANTMTTERKDTVIFTPTGGMGTALDDSLFITQLGTASVAISVTSMPTDLSRLPAAGGRVTATITLSGGAMGWLVMVPRSGFTTSSTPSGMGSGMLNLTYTANTTTAVRKDTVVFSTTGGTGTARDTLVLEQLAATTLSFGVSEGVFADVRVVNPTSDELVIYGLAKEVGLLLRDVSGQVVFEGALPAGVLRVALPRLTSGVYLLVLRTKEGETYNVRLIRE